MTGDDIRFWRGVLSELRQLKGAIVTADAPDAGTVRIIYESDAHDGVHRWGVGERPTIEQVRNALDVFDGEDEAAESSPPSDYVPSPMWAKLRAYLTSNKE